MAGASVGRAASCTRIIGPVGVGAGEGLALAPAGGEFVAPLLPVGAGEGLGEALGNELGDCVGTGVDVTGPCDDPEVFSFGCAAAAVTLNCKTHVNPCTSGHCSPCDACENGYAPTSPGGGVAPVELDRAALVVVFGPPLATLCGPFGGKILLGEAVPLENPPLHAARLKAVQARIIAKYVFTIATRPLHEVLRRTRRAKPCVSLLRRVR
jgi:hypothetical protein